MAALYDWRSRGVNELAPGTGYATRRDHSTVGSSSCLWRLKLSGVASVARSLTSNRLPSPYRPGYRKQPGSRPAANPKLTRHLVHEFVFSSENVVGLNPADQTHVTWFA